ncbi:MAG: GntR family transcriptional regulator [Anaerolineales bacterium]|nr:GntR family transcriptional regulator [Anaerolineales bacterium]
MNISNLVGVPLYIKIKESIREDIKKGVLKRGEKLKSEDELAQIFGVSRMTVRQGISDLIDEGLLYRRHGVGTFVAHQHLERDHSRLTNFFEISKRDGIEVNENLLGLEVMPAKPKIAKALDLGEGDLVICLRTLRYTENVPVTIHEAYLPHKLFSQLLQQDLKVETKNLWAFYEKCGYRVKKAVQRLEARQANEEQATILEIEEGAPILFKERTIYADNGAPIEFLYCYNRGDMYSLTVTLNR